MLWITSKFVTETLLRWLKAEPDHRSSGTAEIEKKPPLSATIAPYFINAVKIAFSSFDHVAGIWKFGFKRKRCPMAGRSELFVTDA